MNINWDSRGSLRPTGKLSIVTADIFQHESAIGPKILSVDEAGVQWMLEHLNFVFDMNAHKLPDPFPARYTLMRRDRDSERKYGFDSYAADAVSVAHAQAVIEEAPGLWIGSHERYEWVFGDDQIRCIEKQTGKPPKKV